MSLSTQLIRGALALPMLLLFACWPGAPVSRYAEARRRCRLTAASDAAPRPSCCLRARPAHATCWCWPRRRPTSARSRIRWQGALPRLRLRGMLARPAVPAGNPAQHRQHHPAVRQHRRALHLVEPLGFELDDARLRRAGLDYHEFAAVQRARRPRQLPGRARPSRASSPSPRARARASTGRLSRRRCAAVRPRVARIAGRRYSSAFRPAQRLRLPMRAGQRSLNLSNAVAVAVFEAWRQFDYDGATVDPTEYVTFVARFVTIGRAQSRRERLGCARAKSCPWPRTRVAF